MQPDPTVEEALRECEEACPCRKTELDCTCDEGEYEGECSYRHTCDCWSIRVNGKPPEPNESIPCRWPGHAAIARYGDLREKAAKLEQAERMLDLAMRPLDGSGRIGVSTEAEDALRWECNRLRHNLTEVKR